MSAVSAPATPARYWSLVLPAALLLMITMGTRQSMGLFISPLNGATGLGIVAISFALAVGQLVWGLSQPLFGVLADRYGAERVLVLGAVLSAVGIALAPLMATRWGLVFTLGIIASAGAGAGAFSILIGCVSGQLAPQRRSFAGGFINAGGSFGQFLFAPLVQSCITTFGWMAALYSLALASIGGIPLARAMRRSPSDGTPASATTGSGPGMKAQLRTAFGDRSYLLVHAGFFTCGLHVAFLMTHLPGEVALCGLSPQVSGIALALVGLANIAGSLGAGVLGKYFRAKHLLFGVYLARSLCIVAFLLAPKTATTVYLFALAMGITFLATVAPTAGLVGRLFGTRYLGTLFGMTLLSHQVGGFLGAWLGGLNVAYTGNYDWMWYADAALALLAALTNLPIREGPVPHTVLARA